MVFTLYKGIKKREPRNDLFPIRHTGWHLMGTAKMGVNKRSSVVNKFGQTKDINNLFIVDSSIFTTSGAVNPDPPFKHYLYI